MSQVWSPDGAFFWDGTNWRQVSPDNRHYFDGATWVQVSADALSVRPQALVPAPASAPVPQPFVIAPPIVRNYKGQPSAVLSQYTADAQRLAQQGYHPATQSSIRQPHGCIWNLLFGWNFGLFMRAPEVMTVTYRQQ